MAERMLIRRRTSHRYSDGWSHLDDWRDIGTVKALPLRTIEVPETYDDGGAAIQTIVLAKRTVGPDMKRLVRAVEEQMSTSRCRHEYDCCGCVIRRARVICRTPRRLTVRVRFSFNV